MFKSCLVKYAYLTFFDVKFSTIKAQARYIPSAFFIVGFLMAYTWFWQFRYQTLSVYLCSDVPLTVTSAFYQGPAGPDGTAGKDGDQVRTAHLTCLVLPYSTFYRTVLS